MGELPTGPGAWTRLPNDRPTRADSARAPKRARGSSALIDAVFPDATAAAGAAAPTPPGDSSVEPHAPMPTATDASEAAAAAVDPQPIVQQALHYLCTELDLECGLVLHRPQTDGPARALASHSTTGIPVLPDEAEHALLWSGTGQRAADLGQPSQPERLRLFAVRSGYAAVIAVDLTPPDEQDDDHGALLILVGGSEDQAGRVRPRTLAHLEALASRLRSPLARARTASRLSALDDEVLHLDRLALLGSLVAEVIHEVRNPLVSIKTFLELLPERLDDPDFHGGFRELVVEEVFRLERLLDEVLAHARSESQTEAEATAHCDRVLEDCLNLLGHKARQSGIDLTHTAPDDAVADRVTISPDALRQILLNLIVNALQATPERGQVRISHRRRTAGRGPANMELWVEDDGPGVPEADRELIFEPFRSGRSDAPGGLGLAISRRLAERAGGRLFVVQSPEGGARFILRLPLDPS